MFEHFINISYLLHPEIIICNPVDLSLNTVTGHDEDDDGEGEYEQGGEDHVVCSLEQRWKSPPHSQKAIRRLFPPKKFRNCFCPPSLSRVALGTAIVSNNPVQSWSCVVLVLEVLDGGLGPTRLSILWSIGHNMISSYFKQ